MYSRLFTFALKLSLFSMLLLITYPFLRNMFAYSAERFFYQQRRHFLRLNQLFHIYRFNVLPISGIILSRSEFYKADGSPQDFSSLLIPVSQTQYLRIRQIYRHRSAGVIAENLVENANQMSHESGVPSNSRPVIEFYLAVITLTSSSFSEGNSGYIVALCYLPLRYILPFFSGRPPQTRPIIYLTLLFLSCFIASRSAHRQTDYSNIFIAFRIDSTVCEISIG